MRIQVNSWYIHQNNLVQVVGAKSASTIGNGRYLIQWSDIQGRACSANVDHYELSEAPTLQRLYRDYQAALEVICQQANIIQGLEEKIETMEKTK